MFEKGARVRIKGTEGAGIVVARYYDPDKKTTFYAIYSTLDRMEPGMFEEIALERAQ